MTATNHVLTGAAIAVLIPQPVLAIIAAFVSHFVLDVLPHFGLDLEAEERDRHKVFRFVLLVDIILTVAAFLIVPVLAAHYAAWWLVALCMAAAYAPDLVWVHRFLRAAQAGEYAPHGRFALFHKNIQWGESPHGMIVEIAWLAGAITVLAATATTV